IEVLLLLQNVVTNTKNHCKINTFITSFRILKWRSLHMVHNIVQVFQESLCRRRRISC
ncbi:hypothetical protein FWK35_00005938, partial [Aphis craccivora]